MKIIAKQNRELILINAQNTQNENNAEILEIEVPEKFENYNKKIVFVTDDGVVWDIIENNQYKLQKAITKYKRVEFYIWLTQDDEDWRSKTKTLIFYENQDASEEITPEEISGVNTVINLLEDEIDKVDRLNITAEKVGKITTLTITDKDGTQTSYEILDGNDGQDGDDYVITPEDYQAIANIVLQTISVPTKTSDLTNDSGFIDNTVNNLTNYYNKNQSYNKEEIDGKLASIYKYKGTVATYSDLPSTGLTIGDVYNVEEDGSNYAWNGTEWDKLGGDVDLSGYYNKTQTDTLLNGKVDNATLNDYYTKTRADELLNTKVDKTTYNSKVEEIETELGEKIEESDLAEYVKNTDYALDNKGGTTKNGNGFYVTPTNGIPYCSSANYQQYLNDTNARFIAKGTLENVIAGKQLINQTQLEESQTAQDELISELQEENKELYDAMAKVTGSGTDVTLNNTAKGKMPIEVSGNTEQENKVSPNLFDEVYSNLDETLKYRAIQVGEGTFTMSSTTPLSASGASLFFLAGNVSSGANSNTNGVYINRPITLNSIDGYVTVAYRLYDNPTEYQTQIEKGATASDYHPYEATSPSPDWESPVKVVTGENTVVVENKNLFDGEMIQNARNNNDGKSIITSTKYIMNKNSVRVLPNTTYTFSATFTNNTTGGDIHYLDENGDFLSRDTLDKNGIKTTPNNCYFINFQYFNSTAISPSNVISIQIEQGSNATLYEEHKEQDFPISLSSRNLFNKTAITNNMWLLQDGTASSVDDYYISDYIAVVAGTKYYFPKTLTRRLKYYDKNKNVLNTSDWDIASGNDNQVLTIPNNAYYVRFTLNNVINSDTYQFEQGSTATEYQPYYNYELCKIGEYKDYIYKDNGKWYVKKNISKVVFDGTQTWSKRNDIANLTNISCFRSSYSTEVNSNAISGTVQISNKFTCLNNTNDVEHLRYTGAENYRFQLFINKSRLSTDDVAGLNSYLSSNNVPVYLPTTPTDIEITNTTLINQLEAIYNTAKSYKGTTHIYTEVEEGNVAPIINAEAIMDLNALVQ